MTAVPQPIRRRSYHLGNVRAQLLTAAREILEDQGKARLSLRAIAERAGVAPGTVYYHYADKNALLGELAVDGFRELAQAMRKAFAERGEMGGLRATGAAYLGFVREKPALYELMYEARDAGRRDDVIAAEAEAIEVSRDSIMSDFTPLYPRELALQMADAIWIWGRGIGATLLANTVPGETPEEEAMQSAVRGLEALITRR
jgi:AcrR family transcriptional regulator